MVRTTEPGNWHKWMLLDDLNAEMLEKAGFINIVASDSNYSPGLGIHEMGTARMGRDGALKNISMFFIHLKYFEVKPRVKCITVAIVVMKERGYLIYEKKGDNLTITHSSGLEGTTTEHLLPLLSFFDSLKVV